MSHAITPLLPTDSKSKIEALLAALPESWNRHDIATLASHFSENADFVNILGMHWRGRAAIEAQFTAIHETVFRHSHLQNLDHSLRFLTPDVAVAHVDWQMTGHETGFIKKSGAAMRKGVFTAVLLREGDSWCITALHNTDAAPVPGLGK